MRFVIDMLHALKRCILPSPTNPLDDLLRAARDGCPLNERRLHKRYDPLLAAPDAQHAPHYAAYLRYVMRRRPGTTPARDPRVRATIDALRAVDPDTYVLILSDEANLRTDEPPELFVSRLHALRQPPVMAHVLRHIINAAVDDGDRRYFPMPDHATLVRFLAAAFTQPYRCSDREIMRAAVVLPYDACRDAFMQQPLAVLERHVPMLTVGHVICAILTFPCVVPRRRSFPNWLLEMARHPYRHAFTILVR